jgi:hypothetical protein
MIWTYRIFCDQKGRYSIREVYYEDDGRLISYGKKPVAPIGASLEELIQLVQWFREAFDAPVLSLEAVETEISAHPLPTKKPLADRSQTLSFQQVLAQFAAETDEETAEERETVPV